MDAESGTSMVCRFTGMNANATAMASMLAHIPQAVQSSNLRRPSLSTRIMFMNVMTKFGAATTRPTAVGFVKPTMENSVEE